MSGMMSTCSFVSEMKMNLDEKERKYFFHAKGCFNPAFYAGCVYITGYSIDPDFSEYKYEETTSPCASETGLNEVQANACKYVFHLLKLLVPVCCIYRNSTPSVSFLILFFRLVITH